MLVTEEFYSQTVHRISHDLKTPLSVIMMQLELMQLFMDEHGVQYKPLLDIAMQNSIRLSRLISNFSDLVRIQSGYMENRVEQVDLVRFLQNICRCAQPYADTKTITIRFDSKLTFKYVIADVDILERVVLNLISNAIKHSPQRGDILVCVREDERKTVNISVQDYGTGMPDNLISIFNMDPAPDISSVLKIGTAGWGLVMVKSYAKFLGGSVYCRSESGQGSIFTVALPWHAEDTPYEGHDPRSLNFESIIRQELSDIVCI